MPPVAVVNANSVQAIADSRLGPGRCACALVIKPDNTATMVTAVVAGGARFEVGTFDVDLARDRTQLEVDALATPLFNKPNG